ncbi:hypothetical protein CC85DRAFT_283275 [Cutaneotrichosporon oleaginosum]|uniref:Uncharacterized protein n=1 Tax=Cutaneotrichosporon oleaginosum TaxID=879819 RepID=A0A0J0XU70_9TREE|nr:uncharacterized protein CC85DRAFT_283275 [Cutaneotrichosporon oleaginosum]KLT44633.1 hypothetical protein CC85DRAFT_283275 [Cutaneotrichosporon oleaginosum]TXT07619.1 hypothetical protein COLE_04543 [Cutaneotrichosporon oleaginosum]
MSSASAIPVATWVPTPSLAPMVQANDPRCNSYPPPYTVDRVTPKWEGSYDGVICTTYNTSYTFPCCQHLGGEARTWCGRVQCLLEGTRIDDWSTCVGQLMAETGGQAVGLACDRPNLQGSASGAMFNAKVGAASLVVLATATLTFQWG